MRTHHLAGVAALALALGMTAGMTAAPAQDVGSPVPQQGPQDRDKPQDAAADAADKAGLITVGAQEQTRISDIIAQQRIRPATRLNFPLSVAGAVPSSVRLSPITGELADIFPHYRDFSFFVTKDQLVIVDPQSHAIVGFVRISAQSKAAAAPPRANAGTVGTAEPAAPAATEPAPATRKTERSQRKRATAATQQANPGVDEREIQGRGGPRTETDATVGASRRTSEADELPPPRPDRGPPPVRPPSRRDSGPPFPFSLLFGNG